MSLPRVAILASGGGSNAAALMDAMAEGRVAAEPALVLTNTPGAGVLQKAEARGVETALVDHRPFRGDRAAFDAAWGARLEEARIDLVCLAGFLRIMTPAAARRWEGRMLNIHPSLLPLFRGLDTHARALAAGVAIHGCTVHEVVAELDAGPILGQAAVPVMADDTAETLAARVLVEEHKLYPAVLAAFVEDAGAARRGPIAQFPD